MSADSPAPGAEDIFADWLERHEAGEMVPFADVCRAHPEHTELLQKAQARWQAMTRAFAALTGEFSAQPETPVDDAPFKVLPEGPSARYALGPELARGAMGRIVQARDQQLDRDVALKIARGEPTDRRQHERFLREARLTGQLDHPGIVPIHELGVDGEGRPFFAMRLVQGRDLAQVFESVRRGEDGWSRTRALHVLLRVCEAMAYAHSKGVVHRDLKPGNVMVGQFSETYVMDWGLARLLAGGTGPRTEVVGTPAYMAPEQARGEGDIVDARTDVYAVGAMLYHLLAGHMPYVAEGEAMTPATVLARVLQGPPPPLCTGRELPAELAAICARAMARESDQRYASMAALAEDLRAFLEVRVVAAWAGGPWAELRKWVQRNRGLATAVLCALVLLMAGLLVSTQLWRTAESNRALADANARGLRSELDRSEFERARLALKSDDALAAETLLWRQYATGAHPRAAHWALWELYSRNPCLAAEPARTGVTELVAFAPPQQLVLAGGADGLLRTLRADSLQPCAELRRDGPTVHCVAVQGTTGTAAVGTADGIAFWQLDPPRLLHETPAGMGGVRAVAAGAAGFASGGDDGRVLWWSGPGAEPQQLHRHAHSLRSLRVSPSGRWLASGDTEGGLALCDRGSGAVHQLRGCWSHVMGLSFAPDETQLWSGGADHYLRVWDLATRTCLAVLPSQNATIRDLLHLDADTVAAGGWWRIDAWRTGTRQRAPLLLSGVWTMDHDPSTARLVASHANDLRLFDLSARGRIAITGTQALLGLSGDGRRVAIYDGMRRLCVRSLPDGALVRDFGILGRHPERILLDGTGRRLLLARSLPGDQLRVFDIDSGEPCFATAPPGDTPFRDSYALRPDGEEVAVVHARKVLRRFSLATGEQVGEWTVDSQEILRANYTACGRTLVVCARRHDGVLLWDLAADQHRNVPTPFRPSCATLSPDGRRTAVGGWNGEIVVIEIATGQVQARHHTGNGTAWGFAWSPADPELLACASGAGPVTFFDLASGRACLTWNSGTAVPARALTISADGATLTVHGEEGAEIVDLTYFDRHIAGNLEYQLARLQRTEEVPAARAAALRREAAAVQARPWPRLQPW